MQDNASAYGNNASAGGMNSTAIGSNTVASGSVSTAIGSGAIATGPHQITFGTPASYYTLPGLASSGEFVGTANQTGETRIVTVDQSGNLGTAPVSFNSATVDQLEQGLVSLGQQMESVGALAAALSSIPNTVALDSNGGCGVGAGIYGSSWAGALGCVTRITQAITFNAAASITSAAASSSYSSISSVMGRLGFFFQF